MRLTVVDVAREAGVSPATVDRVLNNRSGVRSRTRDVVLATARRLGYIAAPTGGGAPEPAADARLRLDFVLPRGTNAFMQMLHEQIEAQGAARPDLEVRVETIEGFNPDSLAATLHALRRPDAGRWRGGARPSDGARGDPEAVGARHARW